ncbi:MAG: helix-turn-helix domain-containing protein [Acetatifactor sp.]
MELKIGTKIVELRRKKGMTQEQLAAILGVSAPAVSKWETDSSCPDIALLCPLARALGTNVDTLLSFEEELSQESMGQYMNEIIRLSRQGETGAAEERLNGLLRAYPSNIPLKFCAMSALTVFDMNERQGEEETRQRWRRQKKELAQAIHDDGNPAFYLASVSMLVALALEEEDLESAEKLLRENIGKTGDFTYQWMRLYLKKGQRDQALEVLQRQTYKLVGDLRACLASLMEQELGLERHRVLEICRIMEELDGLFYIQGSSGLLATAKPAKYGVKAFSIGSSGLLAEVYLREGDPEKALEYLETLTEQIVGTPAAPNPLIFAPAINDRLEQAGFSREIKMAILQGLEKDACFAPLRGQERFDTLVRRIADNLEDN